MEFGKEGSVESELETLIIMAKEGLVEWNHVIDAVYDRLKKNAERLVGKSDSNDRSLGATALISEAFLKFAQ